MEENPNYVLEMFDPEEKKTYNIHLDEEEYLRAKDDQVFANQLLHNVLKNRAANALRNTENDDPNSNESETSSANLKFFPGKRQSISQSGQLHIWQYNEVLSLIRSMEVYFENLRHPKKRKHVFENILNDLLSEGYSLTAEMVSSKWKSLVRSYNSAKDNKNKTGRAPSRFHFFEEMDGLQGNKPSNSCKHSLKSSKPEPLNENIFNNEEPAEEPTAQFQTQEETEIHKKSIDSPGVTPKRKRTSVEDKREAEKKRRDEAKQQRHMERMQAERQKIEVEKEKVKLFKEFLELKKTL